MASERPRHGGVSERMPAVHGVCVCVCVSVARSGPRHLLHKPFEWYQADPAVQYLETRGDRHSRIISSQFLCAVPRHVRAGDEPPGLYQGGVLEPREGGAASLPTETAKDSRNVPQDWGSCCCGRPPQRGVALLGHDSICPRYLGRCRAGRTRRKA